MLYQFDTYELDTDVFELRHDGKLCKLERQVFDTLAYLVKHHDRLVTKDELLDHVWGNRFVSEAALNSRLMAARRAVGDTGRDQRLIRTAHGRGYRFVGNVSVDGEGQSGSGTGQEQEPYGQIGDTREVFSGFTQEEPERRHNLLAPLTRFIGREAECRELHNLLSPQYSAARLVTLAGVGGVGKTRLSIEVGLGLVAAYRDGVCLAELASLSDPALVPQAIASALELRDEANRPPTDTLIRHLQHKQVLLILDNCEHLLESCAALVDTLLRACPEVRVLATSRQPLGIGGETIWQVPSLSLPNSSAQLSAAEMAQYEAIQLFVDRATTIQPHFDFTNENAAAVALICRHVDGMPLAIELAAARVRHVSIDEIAARLGDRFRLLTAGSRTAPPRQQTLLATVDWSYGLLTDAEQTLFSRLSVFAGGWSLEAAETVCDHDDGRLDQYAHSTQPINSLQAPNVLDLLSNLVDKSLVVAETGAPAGLRYRLLETLRQYGQERLAVSNEQDWVRLRHAHYFLDFVRRAEAALTGPEQVQWLDQLEREHDNLRAALQWSRDNTQHSAVGLQLGTAIWRFWWLRGYLTEGRTWLESLISIAGPSTGPEIRSKALYALGVLAFRQGDYTAARANLEESLAFATTSSEQRDVASAFRQLGRMDIDCGEFISARSYLESSVSIEETLGHEYGGAWSLGYLGLLTHFEGDHQKALELIETSLTTLRRIGDRLAGPVLHYYMGRALRDLGDIEKAQENWAESLKLCSDQRYIWPVPYLFEAFASFAIAKGEPERGMILAGAAGALHETIGAPLPPVWQADLERRLEPVRTMMDEAAINDALARGRLLTVEQATAYALGETTAMTY